MVKITESFFNENSKETTIMTNVFAKIWTRKKI